MAKPMTRKSITVDVRTRKRLFFRLGNKVYDRKKHQVGIIMAILPDGAHLRLRWYNTRVGWITENWFTEWADIRPSSDRKYL